MAPRPIMTGLPEIMVSWCLCGLLGPSIGSNDWSRRRHEIPMEDTTILQQMEHGLYKEYIYIYMYLLKIHE